MPHRALDTYSVVPRTIARLKKPCFSRMVSEPEVTPVAFGIAGSSNGRTALSGGVYLGSSPSPAAKLPLHNAKVNVLRIYE